MSELNLCMICEDEVVIGIALEDEFREANFEVLGPFVTCASALTALEKQTPDVAVIDPILKDGSCAELARELARRNIPYVIFSGGQGRHAVADFRPAQWIVKPAHHRDVVEAVRRLVANTSPWAATPAPVQEHGEDRPSL